jgi:hypothetical protein
MLQTSSEQESEKSEQKRTICFMGKEDTAKRCIHYGDAAARVPRGLIGRIVVKNAPKRH